MTILDLQKTLKNQIAKQGRAIISEATIKEAGLTPQVGFDKTLTDYLLLQTDLYITNIPDVPDPQSNTLTIEGKGAFFTSSDDKYKLLIKLAKFDLKVTFVLNNSNVIDVIIIANLSRPWKFINNFPYMNQYIFAPLDLSEQCYICTTAKSMPYKYRDTDINIVKGLNFASLLDIKILDVLEGILHRTQLNPITFTGSISTNNIGGVQIWPQADLVGEIKDASVNIGENFEVDRPGIEVVSLLDPNGLPVSYLTFYVYLKIGKGTSAESFKFYTSIANNYSNLAFGLVNERQNGAVTTSDISSVLGDKSGELNNAIQSLPKELDIFNQITLTSLGASLSLKPKPQIIMLGVTIGSKANTSWKIVDDLYIEDISFSYNILNPFTKQSLSSYGLSAELALWQDIFKGKFAIEMFIDSSKMLSVSGKYQGEVLLADIARKLAIKNLPTQLAAIQFEDFGIWFKKVASNYTYGVYGSSNATFELNLLGDKKLNAHFSVSLSKQINDFNIVLDGSIQMDSSYFLTHINLSKQIKTLEASFSPVGRNSTANFQDVLSAFGLKSILPSVLNIDLPKVGLEYYFTPQPTSNTPSLSKVLNFDIDFQGNAKFTFDLYNKVQDSTHVFLFVANLLGLAQGLPLVGKYFANSNAKSRNQAIGLTYASENITIDGQSHKQGFALSGIPELSSSSRLELVSVNEVNTTSSIAPSKVPAEGYWIPVQKNVGPLSIQRVGLNYESGCLEFMLDATLNAKALVIELLGLGIGIPIEKGSEFRMDLLGLGLQFNSGMIAINGQLLKASPTNNYIKYQYDGELQVKAGQFGLSALGSYSAQQDGTASMFMYAVIDFPLGGPPCFFITGGAIGFGYNRELKIPGINGIATYPLITAATNPAGSPNFQQMLYNMSVYMPVKEGQYWGAAGVNFTSFEMLDSFALAYVTFGVDFEIGLLGLSTLKVPQGATDNLIGQAILQLEARLSPSSGVFSVVAQLTTNSYILSPACHLTGGFAFYLWYAPNEHAGDFVITLGGYHPNFSKPSWYPNVPRIGINWQMPDYGISIKGGMYFALTPVCIMAGGKLEAIWSSGPIKAWFDLYADFLIAWKPYHYNVDAGVDIGVDLRLDFGAIHTNITVHLGADISIWGPEFSGQANIHLYIISFTINFGAGSDQKAKVIGWKDDFCQLLPERSKICTISASNGLLKSIKGEKNDSYWIMDPNNFELVTNSVIPSKSCTFNKQIMNFSDSSPNVDFGVGLVRVESSAFDSTHKITINKLINENDAKEVKSEAIRLEPVLSNVSKALWQSIANEDDKQHSVALTSDTTINKVLVGVKIIQQYQFDNQAAWIPINVLIFAPKPIGKIIRYGLNNAPVTDPFDQGQALQKIAGTIENREIRNGIIGLVGMDFAINIAPLKNNIHNDYFTNNPILSYLGEEKPISMRPYL